MIALPDLITSTKYVQPFAGWSGAGNDLSIVSTLDIRGITIQAVRLRLEAYRDKPDEAVTVQLEHVSPRSRPFPLCRLDWRPISERHRNKAQGPAEFRNKIIVGTHYHPFEHNYFEPESRMRSGNLPVAVPIVPDFDCFERVLEFCAAEFHIEGLAAYMAPPWERVLL